MILARLKSILGLTADQSAELDRLSVDGASRRGFLRALVGAGAVAATCDAEQLLWTPGEKTIVDLGPSIIVPEPFGVDFAWNTDEQRLAFRKYVEPAMRQLADQLDRSAAMWARDFNKRGVAIGETINVRKPERWVAKGQLWTPEPHKGGVK